MPDNLTAPAAGAVIATDQIADVHYPLTKLAFGALDTATLVTTTNRLPVAVTFPTTQAVSGSVAVSNFPSTQTVDGTVAVTGSVAVTGGLTDAELRATALPVSVSFPASQTVDGSISVGNFPATQTVDGTIAVSNFPSTQTVDGTVGVSGSVAVTGAFFQATQPISAAALPLPTGAATEVKQDDLVTAVAKPVVATNFFDIPVATTAIPTRPEGIVASEDTSITMSGTDGSSVTTTLIGGISYPYSPVRVTALSGAATLMGFTA